MASWADTCEDVDVRPGGGDYDGPPLPTNEEWWGTDCIECGEPIEPGRLRLYALTCSAHATHYPA